MNSQPKPHTFRKNIKKVVILVFVVLIAIPVISVVLTMLGGRAASTPVPGYRVLLNGTIIVDADGDYYIEFSVPEGGTNVQVLNIQVLGNFAVSDNNTIRVYVTNGNNFNSLSPDFSPYYDSGLSTTGNINATLPSGGTYYLVYDNYNISQTSEKIVKTQVTLTYVEF